jgi:hypothetical protein
MTELINSKTWTKTRVTATGSSGGIANKKLLVAVKNQMISSGGWVVVSSSDGVSSGSIDYWVDDTDIVIASEGTAHSWIVLQNNNVKTGFQICINMNVSETYGRYGSVHMSPSIGFSGGSTANMPTASDIVWLLFKCCLCEYFYIFRL